MRSLVHSDSKSFDSFFLPQENVKHEEALHDVEVPYSENESRKEVEEIKAIEVAKNTNSEEEQELPSPDDTKSLLQTPNKHLKSIKTKEPEDRPIEAKFTIKRYRLRL